LIVGIYYFRKVEKTFADINLMEPVIKVEGLSKHYVLKREGSKSYTTLSESISGIFKSKENKDLLGVGRCKF